MNKMWMSIALCASVLSTGMRVRLSNDVKYTHRVGVVTSAGDEFGVKGTNVALKHVKVPWKHLVMRGLQSRTFTIIPVDWTGNDQQAALWMDCVEEKSCELLKTSGGRFWRRWWLAVILSCAWVDELVLHVWANLHEVTQLWIRRFGCSLNELGWVYIVLCSTIKWYEDNESWTARCLWRWIMSPTRHVKIFKMVFVMIPKSTFGSIAPSVVDN